jgi:hypothetical protein
LSFCSFFASLPGRGQQISSLSPSRRTRDTVSEWLRSWF